MEKTNKTRKFDGDEADKGTVDEYNTKTPPMAQGEIQIFLRQKTYSIGGLWLASELTEVVVFGLGPISEHRHAPDT
ncbi:hypothetical protein TSMEX_004934 [Taenia solium]|eukprot:TsM_001194400 transcript=TsM_001194400 gene=TsM_001194400